MESVAQQSEMFTRMWMEMASKMAAAGMAMEPGSSPSEAARRFRGVAFESMSEYFDRFMRSPQFLQSMKLSMDTAIALRKQWNDMLARMHDAVQVPGKEDIDSLMLTMQRLTTRMLDRIDELDSRLAQVEARLEDLAGGEGDDGPAKSPRTRRGKAG